VWDNLKQGLVLTVIHGLKISLDHLIPLLLNAYGKNTYFERGHGNFLSKRIVDVFND